MYRLFKLALCLMMALMPFSAQAADYYVDIANNTGYTIYHIYVSPGTAKSWEEDVLGSEIMTNGTTRRISLSGYMSSIFDIRLVDEDGDSYTLWDVDVSTQDITATLEDIDP